MFKKIITAAASAVVVAGVLLAAPANAAGVTLNGGGSSFAAGAIKACAADYTTNSVNYTTSSSGTGRTNYANSSFQYAASDGTFTTEAFSGSNGTRFVTVPLLGGPVVFAYSAVGVNDGLKLTPAIVSGIFKGTITRWDDAALKALNPKVKLPKKAIKVALRTSGSGTTANLTNYLSQTVGGWTANSKDLKAAAGATFAPLNTEFATSQLLAAYVEDNANSFGYFDLSDAVTADVGIAALQNVAGAYVMPTASAAAKFIGAQTPSTDPSDKLNGTLVIDFTKNVPGAYQLSIVTYGVAPRKIGTTATNSSAAAVQDFFNYVVKTCIPAKAASLGYVALNGALKTSALNQIKQIG
jgi:phosphate transport system substrate-binding protein